MIQLLAGKSGFGGWQMDSSSWRPPCRRPIDGRTWAVLEAKEGDVEASINGRAILKKADDFAADLKRLMENHETAEVAEKRSTNKSLREWI